MPKKNATKAYKLDTEKKIITIFDNIPQTAKDKADIAMYVAAGYVIKHATKTTVDEMRDILAADPKALAEFDRLYKSKKVINEKGKEEIGFHAAVKFYNKWKKEQEEAAKEE